MKFKKSAKFMPALCTAVVVFLAPNVWAEEPAPPQQNSTTLKRTAVTSHLETGIVFEKNLLYCSTFQIAWNELADQIIKAPVELNGNTVDVPALNRRLTGKEDILPDAYVAMAGFKKDGIEEKVTQALQEKFNEAPGFDFGLTDPNDILAYAYLKKDLQFANQFEGLRFPVPFNDETTVAAFGIADYTDDEAHRRLGEQVEIIDYKNFDDFIVRLKSINPNDEIILAKILPKKTLLQTVQHVLARQAKARGSLLHARETIRIPTIDFDILHHFAALEGKPCLNKGFEGYTIAQAMQSTGFRLNERGVLLRSEAAVVMMFNGLPSVDEPRNLIFDKPFLLLLKQKGAKYPYFALWIGNAELLKVVD